MLTVNLKNEPLLKFICSIPHGNPKTFHHSNTNLMTLSHNNSIQQLTLEQQNTLKSFSSNNRVELNYNSINTCCIVQYGSRQSEYRAHRNHSGNCSDCDVIFIYDLYKCMICDSCAINGYKDNILTLSDLTKLRHA